MKYYIVPAFFGGLAGVSLMFSYLLLGNIKRTGEFVMLENDPACYVYLGWSNGHMLQDKDTGALMSVYVQPIASVVPCGESK